jgi:hypothetical protein
VRHNICIANHILIRRSDQSGCVHWAHGTNEEAEGYIKAFGAETWRKKIRIFRSTNEEERGDLENVLWRETAQFVLFTKITSRWVISSRIMSWTAHGAHVGEMGKWTMFLDGTVVAKNPVGVLNVNGSIFLKECDFHLHTID